jgi:hypothetical protein
MDDLVSACDREISPCRIAPARCRQIARHRTALSAGEALMTLTLTIHPAGRCRSSSDLFVRIVAFFISVFVLQTSGGRQQT